MECIQCSYIFNLSRGEVRSLHCYGVLIENEEDLRLVSKMFLFKEGFAVNVYANYDEYSSHKQNGDIVISSNHDECKKYNLNYIEKPYTAFELIHRIRGLV